MILYIDRDIIYRPRACARARAHVGTPRRLPHAQRLLPAARRRRALDGRTGIADASISAPYRL